MEVWLPIHYNVETCVIRPLVTDVCEADQGFLFMIEVSLSEPHTSTTSLHACVCMLIAWTDHLP